MSFLLFGSTWFWIIFLVATILVIVATEHGSGIGATLTLLITMALLFFFGNKVQFKDFFIFIAKNPWTVLSAVIVYIVLGVCWAILKWYFFLIKARDKCLEEGSQYNRVPNVSAHKSEIMVWMFYWPFSAVWTVLDHPVKKVFLFIYGRIRTRMQTMADKIFEPLMQQHQQQQQRREEETERRRQARSNGSRE